MPVAKFEGWIHGFRGTQGFLSRDDVVECISIVLSVVGSKGVHEFGCFLHQLAILHRSVGSGGPVKQFGQVDKMRLLPNEETTHFRRSLLGAWIGHLHPTQALKTLSPSNLASLWSCFEIPVEGMFQEFRMSPKGKLCLVPPMHLQMEFSKPGVIGKTGFLWWSVTGTVHRQQILTEHNASLQFSGSRVLALWEVYDATFLPVFPPVVFSLL